MATSEIVDIVKPITTHFEYHQDHHGKTEHRQYQRSLAGRRLYRRIEWVHHQRLRLATAPRQHPTVHRPNRVSFQSFHPLGTTNGEVELEPNKSTIKQIKRRNRINDK